MITQTKCRPQMNLTFNHKDMYITKDNLLLIKELDALVDSLLESVEPDKALYWQSLSVRTGELRRKSEKSYYAQKDAVILRKIK